MKRLVLANRTNPIFHRNNARPHVVQEAKRKLCVFGWEILSHPPYSPDIVLSDYHLFQSLQHILARKEFGHVNTVRNDIEKYLSEKRRMLF